MDGEKVVALIGLAISVATFFLGRFSAHQAAGEKNGYLASDIGYIKAGIDDLKTEIKAVKVEMSELRAKVVRIDESVKSAHKRIDEIIQERKGG